MLALLFSFRGRIGRLTYFFTVLGVAAALIGLSIAFLVAVIGGMRHHPDLGSVLGLGLLLIVAGIATLLIAFALQAKRIRDIGLDPILVIPGILVFGVFDAALAQAMPHLTLHHGMHQTIFGLAVNLCITCTLLFWPGRSDGESLPPMERAKPEKSKQPEPAAPAPAPAPVWPTAPARASFGRRGI